MQEQGKPLYDAIIKELRGIGPIEVESSYNFPKGDICKEGGVIISYKTKEQVNSRLFGLIRTRKQVPLASLDDIRHVLAQNPEIGEPSEIGDNYLGYKRLLGEADTEEYRADTVRVRESSF